MATINEDLQNHFTGKVLRENPNGATLVVHFSDINSSRQASHAVIPGSLLNGQNINIGDTIYGTYAIDNGTAVVTSIDTDHFGNQLG